MNAFSPAEIEAFSKKIKVDLASCWLAIPRIQKWGLSLDHPRAGKLARGEMNRGIRAEWSGSRVTMPPLDGRQRVVDADSDTDRPGTAGTWMPVNKEKIAECFHDKPAKDKKWAMAAIHIDDGAPATPLQKLVEKEDAADRVAAGLPSDPLEALDLKREAQKREALALRGALKPRDRPVLDLYVGQGLSIKQAAERLGKKPKTLYETVKRMGKPMRTERLRREWVATHCSIETLAGGVESAPVVLSKTGQLGWDLEVQP
ncbi:MAG: hypothetical protein GJU72_07450 [Acidithiobacillus ferriphilus]|jgi:DNA-binding CsgD family transcriptional regulator|uniref:hypothetical protein n=1 Tax=Acidithiobacillus ferriphilus TaxID=1689834 RepID=UPI002432BC46|nr:hypothetical protein [Acidithiobacillus ferriphilus]MBW9248892.1 hypothetical protein [Acidithiobacillus ferriphilus]MBW9254887.1 hypothetical protein [Acidithiobacillus ferriphilus]